MGRRRQRLSETSTNFEIVSELLLRRGEPEPVRPIVYCAWGTAGLLFVAWMIVHEVAFIATPLAVLTLLILVRVLTKERTPVLRYSRQDLEHYLWKSRVKAISELEGGRAGYVLTEEEMDAQQTWLIDLCGRSPITVWNPEFEWLDSNVPPIGFSGSRLSMWLLPDLVIIARNGISEVWQVQSMRLTSSKATAEIYDAPTEATVLRSQYLHARKDGNPDRRHGWNPIVSTVQMNAVTLLSGSVTMGSFGFLDFDSAQAFADAIFGNAEADNAAAQQPAREIEGTTVRHWRFLWLALFASVVVCGLAGLLMPNSWMIFGMAASARACLSFATDNRFDLSKVLGLAVAIGCAAGTSYFADLDDDGLFDIVRPIPMAMCSDGWISHSDNDRGTCSHHGGVAEWSPHIPQGWVYGY